MKYETIADWFLVLAVASIIAMNWIQKNQINSLEFRLTVLEQGIK